MGGGVGLKVVSCGELVPTFFSTSGDCDGISPAGAVAGFDLAVYFDVQFVPVQDSGGDLRGSNLQWEKGLRMG